MFISINLFISITLYTIKASEYKSTSERFNSGPIVPSAGGCGYRSELASR